MKLKELIIKNFGKISNKSIELTDGINVFYGENESGKTTTHTFIKSMLFGMERGRGRASVGDTFSTYEPWEQPNFYAGVLRFESGGKNFLLERNFDKYSKSARLICEDDGEELSLEHGDLEMLLNGMTAENYENTVCIGQMKIETGQSLGAELQNYATNYYASGDSEINLTGTLKYLDQRKKETEKMIKKELQKKEWQKAAVESEADYFRKDLETIRTKLEETRKKIKREEENQEDKRGTSKKWSLIEILILLVVAVGSFFVFSQPIKYAIPAISLIVCVILIFLTKKEKKFEGDSVLEKLYWEEESLKESWKEKKVSYDNLQEQLSEEDWTSCDEEKDLKRRALELAISRISELSQDVHRELSDRLNQKASAILGEITGGKYTKVFVDSNLKMSIFTGDRRVSLEQLSRGTIEQIYFALRMAASDILHEEEYPIVLDDTFVYYDEERLINTLRWLKNSGKQVLLFTCHKREEELLRRII